VSHHADFDGRAAQVNAKGEALLLGHADTSYMLASPIIEVQAALWK
jgi:hypothetical protein